MVILYIHGLGGGEDSRIPRILRGYFDSHPSEYGPVEVVCRTYDFDPAEAERQIGKWVMELDPVLVIGESLGSIHALKITHTPSSYRIPHLFVSPALNAPAYLHTFAWVALIPGMSWVLNRIYRPKRPGRQQMRFTYTNMKRYMILLDEAVGCIDRKGEYFAFFGNNDHYRKRGIVSIRKWKKLFGRESFANYAGTHFMEEEFVNSLLIPKILLSLQTHSEKK